MNINQSKLLELLERKYKAIEVNWDDIIALQRYKAYEKYDISMLTDGAIISNATRFYLISDARIIKKYSTLEYHWQSYANEILVVIELKNDIIASNIYYSKTSKFQLDEDINSLL